MSTARRKPRILVAVSLNHSMEVKASLDGFLQLDRFREGCEIARGPGSRAYDPPSSDEDIETLFLPAGPSRLA